MQLTPRPDKGVAFIIGMLSALPPITPGLQRGVPPTSCPKSIMTPEGAQIT